DLRPGGRPYANLAQPNNLATLLLFGLLASVYLRECAVLGRFPSALCSCLLLFGIALTQSRTAVLGLLVLAGWLLFARRCGWSTRSRELFIGLAVFFAMLWGLPHLQS